MLEILISFAFATAALAFSPGPDNIFVLTQSIAYGKNYGLATVAGLMTGCLIHTTLIAFGVSELIKQNEQIFLVIKFFGAAYLLFLAYSVYQSDPKISYSTNDMSKKSIKELYITGFWMNVLNPKVTIFFLAFFPQFLFSETLSTVIQFYILGFIFILVSLIVFSGVAILSSTIATYIKKHDRIGVYLKWMQIVVFVAIAGLILL